MNKVVTGVSSVRMGTAICFSFSDGTVEYRDRANMNEMWTEVNLDRINSIHEAGFTQGGESSCKKRPSGRSNEIFAKRVQQVCKQPYPQQPAHLFK